MTLWHARRMRRTATVLRNVTRMFRIATALWNVTRMHRTATVPQNVTRKRRTATALWNVTRMHRTATVLRNATRMRRTQHQVAGGNHRNAKTLHTSSMAMHRGTTQMTFVDDLTASITHRNS